MAPSFLFIQLEFTHAVGPHAGCYVVKPLDQQAPDVAPPDLPAAAPHSANALMGVSGAPGDADVLVIAATSVAASSFGSRRRLRRMSHDEAPDPVSLLRATFVRATEPLDAPSAQAALARIARSEDECQVLIDDGVTALNRAVRAYRAVAADPFVGDVSARDARRIRVGHGTIDELMRGEWNDAAELARPRVTRKDHKAALRPYEAVAQALAGRLTVLEGEDVLLRALLDLDAGRTRAAAYQLIAALTLLQDELAHGDPAGFLGIATPAQTPWRELRATAESIVAAARTRPLDAAETARLDATVDAALAAVERARTSTGPSETLLRAQAEAEAAG